MAGRKTLPTNLKILQGTFRPERANKNEPRPDINIPTAPDFLSKDALIEWGRISNQLSKLGLLTDMDMAALAIYCQAWGRIVKYEKIVAEKGKLYKTTNGNIQLSPAMWVVNKAYEQVYKFMSEFGMSPASRAKVSAKPKKQGDGDPFQEFGT